MIVTNFEANFKDCILCGHNRQVRKILELGRPTDFRLLRCEACGLVYADGILDASIYVDVDICNSYPYDEKKTIHWKMDFIRKFIPAGVPGNLLDVGCANGSLLDNLRDNGKKCFGVDISKPMIELGRNKPGLDLFLGTLEEAGYPEAFFDWIISFDVVEHLDDPLSTLREIQRILKPGGLLILELPNEGTWFRWVAKALFFGTGGRTYKIVERLYHPFHRYYFSPITLPRALEATGFRVREMITKESYTTQFGVSSLGSFTQAAIRGLAWLDRVSGRGAKLVVCAHKI